MTEGDSPSRFTIDPSHLGLEERIAFSRRFLGPGYDLEPHGDGRFEGAAEFWMLDGLTAAEERDVTCRVTRIGLGDQSASIRLRLVTAGRITGSISGLELDLSEGHLLFESSAATAHVVLEDYACQAIGLAGEPIGFDPAIHPRAIQFPPNGAESAILARAIASFFDQLRGADRATANRLAKVMTGLVQGIVSSLPVPLEESDRQRRGKLQAMRRYIEDNLAQPALGAEDLLRQFNTSRAVVYRLFSPFGGVAKYLAERRLNRAMTLLSGGAPRSTRIGSIAETVGYQDQRRFARAFRARFGVTPSAARDAFHSVAPEPDAGAGGTVLHLRNMIIDRRGA